MVENKYYVYLHIKETNGKPFYVGKGTKKRIEDKSNRNKWWHNTVKKYGYDIIILEEGLTSEEACKREIYWIKRIGRKNLNEGPLVNLTDGGDGKKGCKISEEQKIQISIRHTGKVNSVETRIKMSKAQKGKFVSEETILKIKLGVARAKDYRDKENQREVASKKVIDTVTGIIYPSINMAAIAFVLSL